MKKVIQNLSEMSDSKEVYASRPNPFVAGFIYCIVLLVIAAVCYSFFGKIEVSKMYRHYSPQRGSQHSFRHD